MLELRTNTLVEDYDYVTRFDPAVDAGREDFAAAWEQYLDGAGECPIKPGGKPTIFRLRHLRKVDRALLQSMARDYGGNGAGVSDGAILWAFRLGVVGVNHPGSSPVNLSTQVTRESRHLDLASVELFSDDVIIDVALRILSRLNLGPK